MSAEEERGQGLVGRPQMMALGGGDITRPVSLLLFTRSMSLDAQQVCLSTLTPDRAGGRVVWRGRPELLLIGEGDWAWDELVLIDYPSCEGLLDTLESQAWQRVGPRLTEGDADLRVLLGHPQGGLAGALLRRAHWLRSLLRYSDVPGEQEPTSFGGVAPTEAQYEALREAEQRAPVVMLNLLRYAEHADYGAEAEAGGQPRSGREAYRRYARVAVKLVLALGGRLVWLGRFGQVLIGADGQPCSDDWDEIALVRYPSLARFQEMIRLAEYQAGHVHREAGLARTVLLATRPSGRHA